MKLVYVAGALNADAVGYIKNLNRMMVHAEGVRKAGFAVFVPGLDFLMGATFGDWDYKDYFDNSQPILERCDAMFIVPQSDESKGTQKEIKRAEELEIPVFRSIGKLREYFDNKKD